MDVHRARFVPYPTHTISCLAFTRSNDNGKTAKVALRLALARTDGSIEIWNPHNGVWVQETVFVSDKGRSVSDLVWTQEPDYLGADGKVIAGQYRLFSTGAKGVISEWDLETGTIKRNSSGNFTDIWCIAAEPRSTTPSTLDKPTRPQDLVVGCVSGKIGIMTTEGNELQLKRFLNSGASNPRCLSVSYQKGNKIVAGFADGTIRVYEANSGRIRREMSLGAQRGLVWKLSCLPNGDIMSADSKGDVRVWDGKSYTMQQRFASHEGDCLDLAVSGDGNTCFSVGVDGRVACLKRTRGDQDLPSWSKVSHRKINKLHGPLKQVAAYDGKNMSILIAGGDKEPAAVVVPLREFGKENMRALPFLPQQSRLVSAPSARLVASWWDSTISIYRFSLTEALQTESAPQQLAAKIRLDTPERIRSVSISPSGDLLAAATNSKVRVFQLAKQGTESGALKIRKLRLPSEFENSGAKLVALSSEGGDGTWLAAVGVENDIQVTKLVMDATSEDLYTAANMTIELERPARRNAKNSGFKAYDETISQLLFSEDADVLVTGDLSGNIDTWELDGDFDVDQKCIRVAAQKDQKMDDDSDSDSDSDDEDSQVVIYGQTWKANPAALPRLDSAPLVLTFRPSAQQSLIDSQLGDVVPAHRRLLAVTACHQLYEFDLREGRLTEWSRRNPTSSLPKEFTKILDRTMGAHWDPRERLWLFGNTFVFMIDVSDDISAIASKRRRHEDDDRPSKRVKSSGAGGPVANGMVLGGPHTQPQTALKQAKQQPVVATHGDEFVEDSGDDDDAENDTVALGLTADAEDSDSDKQLRASKKTLSHWSTFKYRPILGMVVLDHPHRSVGSVEEDVLEVVIVERHASINESKRAKKHASPST